MDHSKIKAAMGSGDASHMSDTCNASTRDLPCSATCLAIRTSDLWLHAIKYIISISLAIYLERWTIHAITTQSTWMIHQPHLQPTYALNKAQVAQPPAQDSQQIQASHIEWCIIPYIFIIIGMQTYTIPYCQGLLIEWVC